MIYAELKNKYQNDAVPLGSRVARAAMARNFCKAQRYCDNCIHCHIERVARFKCTLTCKLTGQPAKEVCSNWQTKYQPVGEKKEPYKLTAPWIEW